MNILEKILEEIGVSERIRFSSYTELLIAVKDVEKIIRSHMDEARDICVPSNDEIEPVSEEFLKDCAETAARYKRNDDSWIPVEDGLPKETEKEYYPVMYVTTSYGVVAWGFYRVKDEQWYLYNDIMEEFESVENNKIIAWQPHPEPYRPKDIPTAKNTQLHISGNR